MTTKQTPPTIPFQLSITQEKMFAQIFWNRVSGINQRLMKLTRERQSTDVWGGMLSWLRKGKWWWSV